jgi:hypothetical protein
MMKMLAAALMFAALPLTANAAWEGAEGGAMAKPVETNTTIELISVHCVDGPVIAVYSKGGGPVLPAGDPDAGADYFYRPGTVRAVVDGAAYPLAAAGSDEAVVLFSEGSEAQSYLKPLDLGLVGAMGASKQLTLAFDITPQQAADGSSLESFARFDLAGAGKAIAAALKPCL